MREVDNLKRKIDQQWKSYAISVKGKLIPPPEGNSHDGKCIYLKVSSYAFANCFVIEKELKQNKRSWYVDSWIVGYTKPTAAFDRKKVKMFPRGRERFVYMYNGYLWDDPVKK